MVWEWSVEDPRAVGVTPRYKKSDTAAVAGVRVRGSVGVVELFIMQKEAVTLNSSDHISPPAPSPLSSGKKSPQRSYNEMEARDVCKVLVQVIGFLHDKGIVS